MNPPAKFVAFLTLLAAVFGVSYIAGTQSQALLAPVQTHTSEMIAPADTVEG
jgi:outer membrane murein-binding lipoprotein Lpp